MYGFSYTYIYPVYMLSICTVVHAVRMFTYAQTFRYGELPFLSNSFFSLGFVSISTAPFFLSLSYRIFGLRSSGHILNLYLKFSLWKTSNSFYPSRSVAFCEGKEDLRPRREYFMGDSRVKSLIILGTL